MLSFNQEKCHMVVFLYRVEDVHLFGFHSFRREVFNYEYKTKKNPVSFAAFAFLIYLLCSDKEMFSFLSIAEMTIFPSIFRTLESVVCQNLILKYHLITYPVGVFDN